MKKNKISVASVVFLLTTTALYSVEATSQQNRRAAPQNQKTAQRQQRTAQQPRGTIKKQTVGELLRKVKDDSRGAKAQMTKTDTNLPSAQLSFQQRQSVNLSTVKPPNSNEIMKFEAGNDQAEYERTLDRQIQELYKLTQKFKDSQNRGELWLRLAELYVEKATLIEARKQDQYDQQLKAFQEGKTKIRPQLDLRTAKDYNRRAIQLYEWYVRDYPRDEKVSQALFFLGYNYFELGDTKKGSAFYNQLTKNYPNSSFVGEAHFALGEYNFENEKWSEAYREYAYLIKDKRHRLHSFSMYKAGWCLFRMGRTEEAIKYMDFIIRMGKSSAALNDVEAGTRRSVNKTRLEQEAMRDIVVFYADIGDTNRAINYFQNLNPANKNQYLEKLAYYYTDKGNRDGARQVFRYLIDSDPASKKSFEYQYQIVQNYFYAKNSPQFKEELYRWISDYNKSSAWAQQNQGDQAFMANAYKLREQTLRNYILQQHQTAQNSRATFSQQTALQGYSLYFQEFSDSPNNADMHFFYAELLYDMKKYEEASQHYTWVAENAPTSKYGAKAAQNLLLSIEKALPKDEELQKRVGDSIEPIPLDPRVEKFLRSAAWYTQKFPNSEKDAEIKFRMGRLYYQTNNFGPAENLFKDIVKKHPKTKYSEYSANLLLDIYNLKKDYAGLEKVGTELLADSSISDSKAGSDIRGVLEKANFKKAQDLELSKDYLGSAQQFQAFATQNPKSELVSLALFNSGVNFERAGKNAEAIQNYKKVLNLTDKNAESVKPKVKKLLAKLYQDSGRFDEAGKLYRQMAQENPKDPLTANYLYNAGAMYEATGQTSEAIKYYTQYTQVNKNQRENAAIILSLAHMLRKQGSRTQAMDRYQQYLDMHAGDQAKRTEAFYWLTKLSRKNTKDYDENRNNVMISYNKSSKEQKEKTAAYVAEFKFEDAEKIYQELRGINIPADPARQKKAVDQKLELMNRLNDELAAIIKLNSPDELVKSMNLLGQANEHMAKSILGAPMPSGFNEEQKKQYMAGIQGIAEPFTKKAKDSYKLAIEKGSELDTYNDGYTHAISRMQDMDPQNYYKGDEAASETRVIRWIGE